MLDAKIDSWIHQLYAAAMGECSWEDLLTEWSAGFGGSPANLSLGSDDLSAAFSTGDAEAVRILIPHLQRALRLERRLRRVNGERQSLQAIIDGLQLGVLLVGPGERIVRSNRVADGMLASRGGLFSEGGRLGAGHPDDARDLTAAIRRSLGTDPHAGATIPVRRSDGGPPFDVIVAPCYDEEKPWERLVTVVVGDRSRRPALLPAVLQRLYGLTPAEARVACAIAKGLSVERIATDADRREGTVRVHLKSIFAKTGARSQADLVRLLLSGPATLEEPAPRPERSPTSPG